MTELRDFTSTPTRKSKKGHSKIMGWSPEGKRYVHDVFNDISQDEESGICEKWEKMYKTLCEAVVQSNEKDGRMMMTVRSLRWTLIYFTRKCKE
jgi:hypothetical protein